MAVFIKLKSLYKNSCVYGFSYRSLSAKSGISINTLKKTIKFFLDKGWCRMHGFNLVFEKIYRVDDTNKKGVHVRFNLDKKHDYKYILKVLRLSLVKACGERFEFVKKISSDYIKPETLSDYKKAKAVVKRLEVFKPISESEKFSISNRKVGSLFGRSKTTGSLLMKFGVANGFLNTFADYKSVNMDVHAASELQTKGYFIMSNMVSRRVSNKVVFTVSFF